MALLLGQLDFKKKFFFEALSSLMEIQDINISNHIAWAEVALLTHFNINAHYIYLILLISIALTVCIIKQTF